MHLYYYVYVISLYITYKGTPEKQLKSAQNTAKRSRLPALPMLQTGVRCAPRSVSHSWYSVNYDYDVRCRQ